MSISALESYIVYIDAYDKGYKSREIEMRDCGVADSNLLFLV